MSHLYELNYTRKTVSVSSHNVCLAKTHHLSLGTLYEGLMLLEILRMTVMDVEGKEPAL